MLGEEDSLTDAVSAEGAGIAGMLLTLPFLSNAQCLLR